MKLLWRIFGNFCMISKRPSRGASFWVFRIWSLLVNGMKYFQSDVFIYMFCPPWHVSLSHLRVRRWMCGAARGHRGHGSALLWWTAEEQTISGPVAQSGHDSTHQQDQDAERRHKARDRKQLQLPLHDHHLAPPGTQEMTSLLTNDIISKLN